LMVATLDGGTLHPESADIQTETIPVENRR
jgi:hypothetical protein